MEMSIHEIILQLNESNSSNYKLEVLKQHKDNELLQKVLKMTFDNVTYTYGVSLKQIDKFTPKTKFLNNLETALDFLADQLSTRKLTGHKALQFCADLIASLKENDAEILRKVINRDLKINCGKTQINKVWKDLIVKPVYMRCGVYSDKTSKKISFPAVIQKKADGTYREFSVQGGHVTARSRAGESYEYPLLFEEMKNFRDGIYIGELTVQGITDRSKGNGLINSSEPPHEDIICECWDYITPQEYKNARDKVKNKMTYKERFSILQNELQKNTDQRIKEIELKEVNSIKEALAQVSQWMNLGYEGGVLKDYDMIFKNGTSNQQLKLKVAFQIEVRVVGFKEGRPGTKREKTFGSLEYKTDDGKIHGFVSGFSDKKLDEINSRREEWIGKIIEIEGNDITQARGSETYAISHPRFIEERNDRDDTDTLERAQELLELALELK